MASRDGHQVAKPFAASVAPAVFGLGQPSAATTVRRYVGFLNARNLDGVSSLLHREACLIDSYGKRIEGRDAVLSATDRFFALEPRFHLRIDALVVHEGDIMLRGRTTSTRPEFQADAMWRARVEDGLITCWQSFGPRASARLAELLSGP